MAGILPEKIQWRASKGDLSSNFYLRLLDQDRELLETILLRDSCDLNSYVDLESIRTAYRKYEANPLSSHNEAYSVFTAVNLAIWLRTSGVRP
jgi:asparagine synthase (glutamine-hydrolysing)